MEEKVYEYLVGYGFTVEQIDFIEEKNENIYQVTTYHAEKIMEFLKTYNLTKEEIIKVVTSCPDLISQKKFNLDNIIKILNNLSFSTEEIANLLKYKTKIFTINFKELKKKIVKKEQS